MKTIVYSSIEHFNRELQKYTLIKKGASGTSNLYRQQDKVLLKFCPELLPNIDLQAAEILSSLKVNSFAFAEIYIYIDDVIHGCIMNYVEGTDLTKIDLTKYPINYLIKALQKLLVGIGQLTEKNIWCYDLCKYNIICNRGLFTAIDTIEYQFSTSKEELATNYNIFNDFIGMLFDNYPLLKEFIFKDESLKFYFESNSYLKNYNYYFDKFLRDFQVRLAEYLASSFKTIDEANKKYILKLNK